MIDWLRRWWAYWTYLRPFRRDSLGDILPRGVYCHCAEEPERHVHSWVLWCPVCRTLESVKQPGNHRLSAHVDLRHEDDHPCRGVGMEVRAVLETFAQF